MSANVSPDVLANRRYVLANTLFSTREAVPMEVLMNEADTAYAELQNPAFVSVHEAAKRAVASPENAFDTTDDKFLSVAFYRGNLEVCTRVRYNGVPYLLYVLYPPNGPHARPNALRGGAA